MARRPVRQMACGGALLAVLAATAAAMTVHHAAAADLGGNCCADLEERVAELEATTVRKGNRRVSLTLSGWVARQVMYWNDGDQQDVYSVDNSPNSSRFSFTGKARISPEYTAGFIFEMDVRIGAAASQVSQIDDDGFSGSGGILGGANFGDGIGAGGDSVTGIRQAAWWVESTHYGRLTIGRTNTPTNGISIIDLSNAAVVVTSTPGHFMGSFLLRNGLGRLGSTWAAQCGGPNPSSPFPGAAGAYNADCWQHNTSRRDAARYDTPTIWGTTFGVGWGEDDFWDAALRYAGEWHGFKVAAGVGYRRYMDREPDVPFPTVVPSYDEFRDTDRSEWLTSASIMHIATGLFLTGSYVNYDWYGVNAFENFGGIADSRNRPDIPIWRVEAGIEKNWTGWGNTTFYGEYGELHDGTVGLLADTVYGNLGPSATGGFLAGTIVRDSEVTWWGAGAVQKIDAAAMDLYVAYRQYTADVTVDGGPDNQIAGGLNDIWLIQAGARIQF